MNKKLTVAISPCPNDTFIFHALLHGLVKPAGFEGLQLEYTLADVEKLNSAALAGRYDVTKLSVGVVPAVLGNYALFSSGAALGWGCGPLIVAKNEHFDPATARIAIPGRHTTANLLLDLTGEFHGPRQEMLFSDIMPAISRGDADLGVIIHEGRFTYAEHGLVKILDLGQWWEGKFQLPLPLGAIAVKRDLPKDMARAMEEAIAASIAYARAMPDASRDFIRQNAQELNEQVTQEHIDTFVTDYSLELGKAGREAMETLVNAALKRQNRKLATDLFL